MRALQAGIRTVRHDGIDASLFLSDLHLPVDLPMEPLSSLRAFAISLPFATHAFFACLTCLLLLRGLAPRLGLLDMPDLRKRHDAPVPLVGGLAVYFAVAASVVVFVPHSITALFVVIAGVVLALGVVDDRHDIPARYRILAQLAIAWLTVAYGGVEINRIGNLVGLGTLELGGLFAVVFSVLCIVGVINAYNMIDGVDGLSGSIALVTFAGIGTLCLMHGLEVGTQLSMIFGGALLAFLCLNARVLVPRARVFLGDSGSTLVGFALAWLFISLTQAEAASVSPVVAGWLFGLPLIDTVSVMVRRVSNGISPMTGGRDHMHHRLIDAGWSINRTVATMLAVHTGMVVVGVLANAYPALEPVLFLGFVVLVLCYHAALPPIASAINRRGMARRQALSGGPASGPAVALASHGPAPDATRRESPSLANGAPNDRRRERRRRPGVVA